MTSDNEKFFAPASCKFCSKKFEYDLDDETQSRNFCSIECKNNYKQRWYEHRLSTIPPKLRGIDCDDKELVKLGIDESLILTGSSGVGKSVAVASMCKEILKNPKREVLWLNYPRFIFQLQCLYSKDTKEITAYDVTNEAMSFKGTLVLDDLGGEKLSDSVRNVTYTIISYRDEFELHTLITTNLSLEEIDKYNGSRISSRIVGMCITKELGGRDRRIIKKLRKI
jgi:DNA replication protein DnaC